MKKYKNYLLLIGLLLIPAIVYAEETGEDISIWQTLILEVFFTIPISFFVFLPIAKAVDPQNAKNKFRFYSILRAGIIFIGLFTNKEALIGCDILAIFIGFLIVVPIVKLRAINSLNKKNAQNLNTSVIVNNQGSITSSETITESILRCLKCGAELKKENKFCTTCGAPFDVNTMATSQKKNIVNFSDFDPMYNNNENKLLEEFINKELIKAGINDNNKLIPKEALKRRNILNVIFSILLFIYISLIFFHFPMYTYIVGAVILFVFFKITIRYNLISYLKKEIKSRPNEKISNIVMNVKNSFSADNLKILRIIIIIIAMITPFIVFKDPKILYERIDGGYAMRYYIFGVTNFTTATIPETYKGENVISLRGNAFSNMPFLKSVSLPNTITEIRGQAFKNDSKLVNVNIPTNLEYLGGGAFYNCELIKEIELPDTLTYLGGEAFYSATSLKSIRLSNNITEIRGNTFELCTSLKSIIIPDKVTRIGGHAFYGNSSLSSVKFTENSELMEIGSSAFRMCSKLFSITLPNNVSISERAFKESPTSIKYFYKKEVVDSTKYKHIGYLSIYEGESEVISESKYTTQKDSLITLISIDYINGKRKFNMKYSNETEEIYFTLGNDNFTKIINENLKVELPGAYALDYENFVVINTYYN